MGIVSFSSCQVSCVGIHSLIHEYPISNNHLNAARLDNSRLPRGSLAGFSLCRSIEESIAAQFLEVGLIRVAQARRRVHLRLSFYNVGTLTLWRDWFVPLSLKRHIASNRPVPRGFIVGWGFRSIVPPKCHDPQYPPRRLSTHSLLLVFERLCAGSGRAPTGGAASCRTRWPGWAHEGPAGCGRPRQG